MIDFEKSFIILGKAGMSPKRDFYFLLACVQPPPRLYTGYFTYPIGFFNVMLFLNQHILESETPILKDKGDWLYGVELVSRSENLLILANIQFPMWCLIAHYIFIMARNWFSKLWLLMLQGLDRYSFVPRW